MLNKFIKAVSTPRQSHNARNLSEKKSLLFRIKGVGYLILLLRLHSRAVRIQKFARRRSLAVIKISSVVFFLFLLFAFHKADAQINLPNTDQVKDSVEILITPAFPKANENVSVELQSFSFNLDSSEIIWAVNGTIKDKGIGKKFFSFKTGDVGNVSLLKAIVTTKEGGSIEKSLVVRPSGVDILWEADSYTHPFYKGKALYSYQNFVTLIAVPDMVNSNGVKINPDSLIYKWTKDGRVLGEVSGYGKNKFSFSKSIPSRPSQIEVEVVSSDKKIKASNRITLDPIEPKVVFYENNPLYGIIYNKALTGDFKLEGNEITLTAMPYFFSKRDINGQKMKYNWNMNGRPLDNKEDSRQETFRNTSGTSGATKISVDLQNENLGRELQSARTDVLLNFEEGGENDKTVSF